MDATEEQVKIEVPELPEGSTVFAGSSGDWVDKIYFDAEKAFSGPHEYVEVFDADGNPLVIFVYCEVDGVGMYR